MDNLHIILILIVVLSFVYFFLLFTGYDQEGFYAGDYLMFNAPTRSTRNMSYDLRGDIPIPQTYVGPWNIGTYNPIHNLTLADIS